MTNDNKNTLNHIAIIMDGNGRWAKKNKLLKIQGHQKGRNVLENVIIYCAKINLKSLTVFAFSSENIGRPKSEVNGLFKLFLQALKQEVKTLKKNNIKLKLIGDLSIFSKEIQQHSLSVVNYLSHCDGLILNVALNYGGRWDIIQAIKKITAKIEAKKLTNQDINQQMITQHLSLGDQPPVDMMIRTSDEYRISNFLLWDLAYSELFFTPTLWPDFTITELKEIIQQYQHRNRRFGKSLS